MFLCMTSDIATILSGLLSGIGSLGGAFLAVAYAFRKLEAQELRKSQVSLLVSVYGSRFVMNPKIEWDSESKSRFHFFLNQIGVLYNGRPKVLDCLRVYRMSTTTSNFGSLIRAMCESVGIDTANLTNDDVETVLTLNG